MDAPFLFFCDDDKVDESVVAAVDDEATLAIPTVCFGFFKVLFAGAILAAFLWVVMALWLGDRRRCKLLRVLSLSVTAVAEAAATTVQRCATLTRASPRTAATLLLCIDSVIVVVDDDNDATFGNPRLLAARSLTSFSLPAFLFRAIFFFGRLSHSFLCCFLLNRFPPTAFDFFLPGKFVPTAPATKQLRCFEGRRFASLLPTSSPPQPVPSSLPSLYRGDFEVPSLASTFSPLFNPSAIRSRNAIICFLFMILFFCLRRFVHRVRSSGSEYRLRSSRLGTRMRAFPRSKSEGYLVLPSKMKRPFGTDHD